MANVLSIYILLFEPERADSKVDFKLAKWSPCLLRTTPKLKAFEGQASTQLVKDLSLWQRWLCWNGWWKFELEWKLKKNLNLPLVEVL